MWFWLVLFNFIQKHAEVSEMMDVHLQVLQTFICQFGIADSALWNVG